MTRCSGVGTKHPVAGSEVAVEDHRLDADVVVEPLQMAQVRCGGGNVGVQLGCAVPRNFQVVGRRHRRDAHPFGVAAAPGDIGLHTIDCAGCAHPHEVGQVIPVFARGDIGCHRIADDAQGRGGAGLDPYQLRLFAEEAGHGALEVAQRLAQRLDDKRRQHRGKVGRVDELSRVMPQCVREVLHLAESPYAWQSFVRHLDREARSLGIGAGVLELPPVSGDYGGSGP